MRTDKSRLFLSVAADCARGIRTVETRPALDHPRRMRLGQRQISAAGFSEKAQGAELLAGNRRAAPHSPCRSRKRWPACLASSTLSSMAAWAGMRSRSEAETRPGAARSALPRSSFGVRSLQQALDFARPAGSASAARRAPAPWPDCGRGRERVDRLAAQQIVGVRLAALDRHQNSETRLCAQEKSRARRSTQPRIRRQRIPAQKLRGIKPLLAFELNLEQLKPGIRRRRQPASGLSSTENPPRLGEAQSCGVVRAATAMRCTISFFPLSVVNAPGHG